MNIIDLLFHTHPDGQKFATGELARPEHFLKPDSPQHEEISGVISPPQWTEKNLSSFITYPKRDQSIKFDCTCYSTAKLLSIDELSENGVWRELSPDSVYPFVCVKTGGGGASSLDVMDFVISKGMTLEALYQSDGLSELQAEDSSKIPVDAKIAALIYRPGQSVQCASDFDTIASVLQNYQSIGQKKGVAITVIGQNNGTWLSTMPTHPTGSSGLWYHRVVVTDFGLINGKKTLSIDNSWGTRAGLQGQQFLTEDYAPYIYGAMYTLNIPDVGQSILPIAAPTHTWLADLSVGANNVDVTALQQALQSIGMFPIAEIVKPTGYFGGITLNAVKLFQSSFGLPVTGIVDATTRGKLNEIF